MFSRVINKFLCFSLLVSAAGSTFVFAQTRADVIADNKTLSRYLDQTTGTTADEAVRLALENNGELAAMRKERDAAKSLIEQARLRANPSLETSGAQQINGRDNNLLIQGELPL